jgi:hypothetical protein
VTSAHPRITIEPDKRDGKPCIRGMRITVNDVLGWLSHRMTEEICLSFSETSFWARFVSNCGQRPPGKGLDVNFQSR